MKEKVLSSLIIAMLGVLPCFASTALRIQLKDSTVIVCSLTKEPQMAFSEKTITLTSSEGAVGEWNFTDVVSWSFAEIEDVDDAIREVEVKNTQIKIEDGQLTISGIKAKNVAVYDTGGRQMSPSLTTTGNTTSVNLGGLAKGAYLLKVGKSSLKFIVK